MENYDLDELKSHLPEYLDMVTTLTETFLLRCYLGKFVTHQNNTGFQQPRQRNKMEMPFLRSWRFYY